MVTKVQEVGQLHFQLQEALAKVVGPSVFRFSLVNGHVEKKPHGDVMCGAKVLLLREQDWGIKRC